MQRQQRLDYAVFRLAMRRWIAANHESYDIDYAAAYSSFIKRKRDMTWLEPYISEVLSEYQQQSFVPMTPSCG